jgi:two-component system, cell cycle sensor histidine kinase and response regulator CckA
MTTILIVDDEPVILDVFRRFLENDVRRLVLAGSVREALARAEEAGEIDVALVDKNLGDGSGLDVARALKRLKPDVEVILVTGYASLDTAIQAVQIGAYDYVTKPISDYDALNLKVENAAEKVRMKRRQRELVAQLVESEALHRGVFETSSDAMLIVESETARLEDANPAAERLYGRGREELRGLRVDDLADPETADALPPDHARSVPGRHRHADGTSFPVEVSAGSLVVRERRFRVLSVRDVSERERAETARRELEQNLRQAQKMEAVGRLAGGIAHDFSNMLAVILGWSDMLVRDLPAGDARLRESAEGIVEAAHRAVGVTRQLLTLSRKKLLRTEVLSLNKVVQDLGRLLARAIGERIELSTALQDGLWPVVADSDQLAQVLLNLAVNARDAMPDGGPLAISTANVDLPAAPDVGLPAGRYVALTVKDGGAGMTDEVRARLFEPFFTTKDHGTGLGLATVYGIVRQAGGAIRVDSRPGGGTTFTVFLPPADERVSRIVVPVSAAAPRGLGETVVLAEDEDALRVLLGRVLAGSGYRVIAGRNGAEALEAVHASGGRIDVLLTDVVMPRMNGTELASRLATEQPGVKVLFMTGHTEDGALLGRFDAGEAEIIQKPFTSEALLGHLRRLLGPARASA